MNLIDIVKKNREEFDEKTEECTIPSRSIEEAEQWLKANPDKHLYDNYCYGEPMFDLSADKIKSFLLSSHLTLLEAIKEECEGMSIFWTADGEMIRKTDLLSKLDSEIELIKKL